MPATVRTPAPTIDHSTLTRLVHAGTPVGAEVVANTQGWGIVIHCGDARHVLAAVRGKPRTFRQFDTLAHYLQALGITEFKVNTAAFSPGVARPMDARREAASARMKQAHEAASYDTWFKAQVQAAIEDPSASVSDAESRQRFAARRAALLARAQAIN